MEVLEQVSIWIFKESHKAVTSYQTRMAEAALKTSPALSHQL